MSIAATLPVENKRWGFWATLGFCAIICVVYVFAQGIAMGVVAGIQLGIDTSIDQEVLIKFVYENGFYVSIGIIISAWVGSLVIVTVILLRKDISPQEYLHLKKLPLKVYLSWFFVVVVLIFGWGHLSSLLGQPDSYWLLKVYATAKYLPLLWFAFVIAAPLVEELFFRGFLFEGLRDSWMGATGAVLVTSFAWAATHMQYETIQILMIGILGVFLGIAKIKTRSLYVTFAMHSLFNLIAVFEAGYFFNY